MLINLIRQIYIDMSNADVFFMKNDEPKCIGNIKASSSWTELKSATKYTEKYLRERIGMDILSLPEAPQ